MFENLSVVVIVLFAFVGFASAARACRVRVAAWLSRISAKPAPEPELPPLEPPYGTVHGEADYLDSLLRELYGPFAYTARNRRGLKYVMVGGFCAAAGPTYEHVMVEARKTIGIGEPWRMRS